MEGHNDANEQPDRAEAEAVVKTMVELRAGMRQQK